MKPLLWSVGVLLSLCACAPQTAPQGGREELYKGADYASFVHVAAVAPGRAEHVTALLEANDIPNIVEGSVVYGVSVPQAMKDRAVALLRADSEIHLGRR